MKNATLDEFKKLLVSKIKEQCDFCGLMDGENVAVLNSSTADGDFIITIKDCSMPFKPTNKTS